MYRATTPGCGSAGTLLPRSPDPSRVSCSPGASARWPAGSATSCRCSSRTQATHDKRSALFNSGAEAVENAVKIARHATGRQAVVAFDHAYHGRTNLTMALTAKNMPYKDKFGPFAGE